MGALNETDVERENRMLSEVLTKISVDEYKRLKDGGATLEEIHEAVCRVQEKGESFEPDPPGGPWPELIPFDTVTIPPFPVDKLPPPLDELVESAAECYQVDPAMPGVLSLGVLAALFQGKFKLHVKPGFTTELSLYTCVVAAPGEGKSPVFSCLTEPLNRYERLRMDEDGADIQRNQQERRLLEGRQKALESQLTKGGGKGFDRDAIEKELEDVNEKLNDFEDEVEFRVLAGDTTVEKLIELMSKHGPMLVASDEPGLFDALRGRYDNNSVIDCYLQAIDGGSIRVDRVGRPSNNIPHAHLSMALGSQPVAIKGFINTPTFAGRGLCARFLYANCKSCKGYRQWDTRAIPSSVYERYIQLVYGALDFHVEEPVLLYFDDAAQREAGRFYNEVELALRDGGKLDFDSGWGNKFAGYVFRMAALFHLCAALSNGRDPKSRVEVEWLQAAEAVGWCLAKHTESIFTEAGADPDVEDAKYILRRLTSKGEHEVSKGELVRRCKRFQKASDMTPGLRLLEERNYIQRESHSTGGRPAETIRINPACF